jgi:hypothetical protein
MGDRWGGGAVSGLWKCLHVAAVRGSELSQRAYVGRLLARLQLMLLVCKQLATVRSLFRPGITSPLDIRVTLSGILRGMSRVHNCSTVMKRQTALLEQRRIITGSLEQKLPGTRTVT